MHDTFQPVFFSPRDPVEVLLAIPSEIALDIRSKFSPGVRPEFSSAIPMRFLPRLRYSKILPVFFFEISQELHLRFFQKLLLRLPQRFFLGFLDFFLGIHQRSLEICERTLSGIFSGSSARIAYRRPQYKKPPWNAFWEFLGAPMEICRSSFWESSMTSF